MARWPKLVTVAAIVALPASAFAADQKFTDDAGGRGGEPGFFDIRLGQDPAPPSARLGAGQARLRRALGSQAVVGTDPRTGTPRVITGRNVFLTGPSRARASDVAVTYLRGHPAVFGLDADDIDGLRVVREQRFSVGVRRVQFAQTAHGISSLDTGIRAAVDGKGHLISVTGGARPDFAAAAPDKPALDASGALRRAIADVGSARHLRRLGGSEGADRETRFAGGHSAHLTYFVEAKRVRLAWRILLFDDSQHIYDSIIDASDGTLLRRVNRVHNATGLAWDFYPAAPAGGTATSRDFTAWLSATDRLQGPNALAYSDVDDDVDYDLSGALTPGPGDLIPPKVSGNWDYSQDPIGHVNADGRSCPIAGDVFGTCSWDSPTANSWETNRKQAATQLFYFVNRFHDHLKNTPGIEFDAAAGNFEGNDPVHAQSNDGANVNSGSPDFPSPGVPGHVNNANMFTPPEGFSPKMQMYLWTQSAAAPEPGVNTGVNDVNGADDGGIVFHEYTHGLVDRLLCCDADGFGVAVGPQAGAMNEAWADWYAFDYLVSSGFMTDTAAAGEIGFSPYENAPVRSQPADCPPGAGGVPCPGPVPDDGGAGTGGYTYGDFGKIFPVDDVDNSTGDPPSDGIPDGEVHADGEIWASTLWDLRTAMIAAYGPTDGVTRARALVTVGLLVSPAFPSFLDMRNAIIAGNFALGLDQASCQVIWHTFAARGMGSNASTGGDGDTTPAEGFTDPGAPACAPPPPPPPPPPPVPPKKANLAGAKSSIRVTKAGRFSYAFKAGKGLSGKAVFNTRKKAVVSKKANVTIARKSFTVPSSGKVTLKIKLSRKNLRILKRNHRLLLKVTVTVKNAAGSAVQRKNMTLRAPPR